MKKDSIQKAEKIIESVDIPSQPHILMDINAELLKPDPSFRKISELVSQDISISAKILRVANSSFFSLRNEVNSVRAALSVLGLDNFSNTVLNFALQDVFRGAQIDKKEFKEILKHSKLVARTSQLIFQKIQYLYSGIVFPGQVYMAGLFHDIGILILSKKFKDYFKKIRNSFSEENPLIAIEEKHYKTNHCLVGYLIGKMWSLPSFVCDIIRYHHDEDFVIHDEISLRKMLSLIMLAENTIDYVIKNEYNSYSIYTHKIRSPNSLNKFIEELNLDIDDLKDVEDKVKEIIE